MRILNTEGQQKYHAWVDDLKNGVGLASRPPSHLLEDELVSFHHYSKTNLPELDTPSKYEFISALIPILEEIEQGEFDRAKMPLIYDTLALHYFHFICPKNKEEQWNPFGHEFYCYNPHAQRRYRHRVLGPMILLRAGKSSVKPFFDVPPSQMGEYESNMGSRQQIAGNPKLLGVVYNLYTNSNSNGLIRGHTTTANFPGFKKKLPKPGTIRRFGVLTNQLARVYDIYGGSDDGFVSILPREFDDWLQR